MSPIDDELRSLFTARTDVLTPAADPLAGIERRAKRMRRNRVAASVAGTALAVSALAAVVPALLPEGTGSTEIVPATQSPAPSVAPTPSPAAASDAALDPQHPWAYRGSQAVLGNGNLDTAKREWATKHPGSELVPLFGQVYEPSGQSEIVFVGRGQGGDRWGVVTSSEGGGDFLVDQALPAGTKVLMASLPGDEVARLLVLAAPTTGQIAYAVDGATFRDYPGVEPGVAFIPLEGDTSRDVVRVLDGDGYLDDPVFEGPAPDAAPEQPTAEPSPGGQPEEVTSAPALAATYAFDPTSPWGYRGAAEVGNVVVASRNAFVAEHGEAAANEERPLYAVRLSATTEVAVMLYRGSAGSWVAFTAESSGKTHQVAYQPQKGEDILSAYVALDDKAGLLIGLASDKAANLVLQTGDRAEVGGSKTAGIWDWTTQADPQARLAAFARGDAEPYASQPAR